MFLSWNRQVLRTYGFIDYLVFSSRTSYLRCSQEQLPHSSQSRRLHIGSVRADAVPFRKQLKDDAKRQRFAVDTWQEKRKGTSDDRLKKWQLTSQENIARKTTLMGKGARTSTSGNPNSHVALFDLAFPGSQPEFQKAVLIPALRAASVLGCDIQRVSKFDRKHYFYQDQPAGYQITQYYEPFAKDGQLTLYAHDGIAVEDCPWMTIGIKQVQMEQDTAKSIQQPPDVMLLDFNRAGHPLVEIITLPQIHHPQTAAACVRKIQSLLQSVNAVTTGMEMGGLRADVNVSVQLRNAEPGSCTYHGVSGLGQRTEIKNLSSFKAVEDAVTAERDRQIGVLEDGGHIEGETRGWTLGSTETKRLRGKEGEVDYRYMPDPDIAPVIIGQDLIDHISISLPVLPDEQIKRLTEDHQISLKDAKTLVELDDGERVDYFDAILSIMDVELLSQQEGMNPSKTTANWILHELGGLLSASETSFSENKVSARAMALIIQNLLKNRITGRSAKMLLSKVFNGDSRDIDTIIIEEDLQLEVLSMHNYETMAQSLLAENPDMVEKIRSGKQIGKVQWFVGQMMRLGKGKVEARKAEAILKELLRIDE